VGHPVRAVPDGQPVFGIPDHLYCEKVGAVIVAHPGMHFTASDVTSYCRGRLAPFEIPERITFASKLPLTGKGAIDRFKVTERFG